MHRDLAYSGRGAFDAEEETVSAEETVRAIHLSYRDACKLFHNKYDPAWLLDLLGDPRWTFDELRVELANFNEYWSDQTKRPKSVKRTIKNWLRRASGGRVTTSDDSLRMGSADAALGVPARSPVNISAQQREYAEQLWAHCVRVLKKDLDSHTFKTWITPVVADGVVVEDMAEDSGRAWEVEVLMLSVPHSDFVERLHGPMLDAVVPINYRLRCRG